MKKNLLLTTVFVFLSTFIFAQDYSSYQTGYTTGTDANLYKLKDGTSFDMSGSTERIAASQDDDQTGTVNFGFDFYHYANNRHTNFGVNSNGVIRLGGTPGATRTTFLRNNWRMVSPLAGDLATSATGKIHTKTIPIPVKMNPITGGFRRLTFMYSRVINGEKFWPNVKFSGQKRDKTYVSTSNFDFALNMIEKYKEKIFLPLMYVTYTKGKYKMYGEQNEFNNNLAIC